MIDRNYREMWSERIEPYESKWLNCADGKFSYRLPVVNEIEIDSKDFSRMKAKAIAIQKRYLHTKYDSIVNSVGEPARASIIQVLEELRQKLKPNMEDAQSFTDLYSYLELEYFVTEVKVYLKDGTTKNYIHLATYCPNIP